MAVYCRGAFTVDNVTYSVEPVDGTLNGQHRVYKESDSVLSVQRPGKDACRRYAEPFLPRDATQSAVMRSYVVCPSVCPSECDVQVW